MATNKVVYAGNTLIDLTDTTATAADVAQGKYFYGADGVRTAGTASGGGTPAISVVDTTDSAGGTIRTITALDISDTTAVASDVASGKYFYTAAGVKTQGTASGGGGATQHTIYFEFTDSTDATIYAWYDDSFISSAITATEPTTYGQKTVDTASLDGVTWYTRPTAQWETLFDGNPSLEADDPYPYFWIGELASTLIPVGSVWRITFDGVTYGPLTATYYDNDSPGIIGNPLYSGRSDDGSGVPLCLFRTPWGAWSGAADTTPGTHALKVERQIVA